MKCISNLYISFFLFRNVRKLGIECHIRSNPEGRYRTSVSSGNIAIFIQKFSDIYSNRNVGTRKKKYT